MQNMMRMVRVEEKVKGINYMIVVLKSQMNNLFSGQVQFTIQPIMPISYEALSQPQSETQAAILSGNVTTVSVATILTSSPAAVWLPTDTLESSLLLSNIPGLPPSYWLSCMI